MGVQNDADAGKDVHAGRILPLFNAGEIRCVDAGENDFGRWLRFEPLTLCHFDTSVILTELLDDSEIKWLNDYNERVFRTLSPRLSSEVSQWLREKTLPIAK